MVAAAAPPYLTALNPAQREAVEAIDGPVLVLAGAGTSAGVRLFRHAKRAS